MKFKVIIPIHLCILLTVAVSAQQKTPRTDFPRIRSAAWRNYETRLSRGPVMAAPLFEKLVKSPLVAADRQRKAIVRKLEQGAIGKKVMKFAGRTDVPLRDIDKQVGRLGDYYKLADHAKKMGYTVERRGLSFTIKELDATYFAPPDPFAQTHDMSYQFKAQINDVEVATSMSRKNATVNIIDPKTGKTHRVRQVISNPTMELTDYFRKNEAAMDFLNKRNPSFEDMYEAYNATTKSVYKAQKALSAAGITPPTAIKRVDLKDITQFPEFKGLSKNEIAEKIRRKVKTNDRILQNMVEQTVNHSRNQVRKVQDQLADALKRGDTGAAARARSQLSLTKASLKETASYAKDDALVKRIMQGDRPAKPKFKPVGTAKAPPAPRINTPRARGWFKSMLGIGMKVAGKAFDAFEIITAGMDGAKRELIDAAEAKRDPSYVYAVGKSIFSFFGGYEAWETGKKAGNAALRAEFEAAKREGRPPNLLLARFKGVVDGIGEHTQVYGVARLIVEPFLLGNAIYNETSAYDAMVDMRKKRDAYFKKRALAEKEERPTAPGNTNAHRGESAAAEKTQDGTGSEEVARAFRKLEKLEEDAFIDRHRSKLDAMAAKIRDKIELEERKKRILADAQARKDKEIADAKARKEAQVAKASRDIQKMLDTPIGPTDDDISKPGISREEARQKAEAMEKARREKDRELRETAAKALALKYKKPDNSNSSTRGNRTGTIPKTRRKGFKRIVALKSGPIKSPIPGQYRAYLILKSHKTGNYHYVRGAWSNKNGPRTRGSWSLSGKNEYIGHANTYAELEAILNRLGRQQGRIPAGLLQLTTKSYRIENW